jgi:hypothetical protein
MPVSHKYDGIYRRRIPFAPVSYLRALAHMESGQNPKNAGTHRGLFQVNQEVLTDYNKAALARPGTPTFTWPQMLEAEPNAIVFSWALARRIKALKNTGEPNLQPDWKNPEYLKLITAAWNSGWSKRKGVPRVADYLSERRLAVTHDSVFRHAKAANATRFLWDEGHGARKKLWQRQVAALALQLAKMGKVLPVKFEPLKEGAKRGIAKALEKTKPKTGLGKGLWLILLLLAAGESSRR